MTEEAPPLASGTIVVADDENDILLLLRTALTSAGYTVHTATNGVEAIERVREIRPDLVILDIMMPEKSGLDALIELKADEDLGAISVMMLTGLSDRSKIQTALDNGAEYYIVKPFEYNDLLGKVAMAMQGVEGL
jgi:CheY-like chemotaxis protein